ncbi:MAG: YkoF family thiamine/hydroxymethylpyrimidine-binding protein [Clostridiaceae bacterium]
MITAEVAVYPLKTNDASNVINRSIDALKGRNITITVNSMNTKITGNNNDVFQSLATMFTEAEKTGGEVNMVVTVANNAG